MKLEAIQVGALSTNCYIYGAESGEALVVDPGKNAESIIACIEENRYKVKYIYLTHGHFDHVGALAALAEHTNAPIALHSADMPLLKGRTAQIQLADGMKLTVGGEELTCIHTPGHTPGSTCLLGRNMLFSGDTLFFETIGRHERGDVPDMEGSLRRLMELDDDITVYPGHMRSTTIGHERKNNPYIKA